MKKLIGFLLVLSMLISCYPLCVMAESSSVPPEIPAEEPVETLPAETGDAANSDNEIEEAVPAVPSEEVDTAVPAEEVEDTAPAKEFKTPESVENVKLAEEIASGICGGEDIGTNVRWTLNSSGVMTIYGSGKMEDYDPYKAPWYDDYRTQVKNLVIEDGVTSIGSCTFYGCTSLTQVSIPDSITTIENNAFNGCAIQYLTIPRSVSSIGNCAFWGCLSLKSVTLNEGLKNIQMWAFRQCSALTTVSIPNSVTTIGDKAFELCTSLKTVRIGSGVTDFGNQVFQQCGNALTDVIFTGKAPTKIAENAFWQNSMTISYPSDEPSWEKVIGSKYGGYYGLTWKSVNLDIDSGICGGEGDGTNLTWVLKGNGTLIISGNGKMKDYPGYWYSSPAPWFSHKEEIKKIEVRSGVTHIGSYAFEVCRNAPSVSLPDTLKTIGGFAFYDCGIAQIYIPIGVTSLGEGCFNLCGYLQHITLPNSVASIGYSAFAGCKKLSEIRFPTKITDVSNYMCSGCSSLKTVLLPGKAERIGAQAFYQCTALETVTIPENVTKICAEAFAECSSLTSVYLPESLATLLDGAFRQCSTLTDVIIPAGVTEIQSNVFTGCSNLTYIAFSGNAPTIGSAFGGVTATAYYPAENETWTDSVRQNYGGNLTWTSTVPLVTSGTCGAEGNEVNVIWAVDRLGRLIISGTGKMADYDMDFDSAVWRTTAPWHTYNDQIRQVIIADGVTSIGEYAFYWMNNFVSLRIGSDIESIGSHSFTQCHSLREVFFNAKNAVVVNGTSYTDGIFKGSGYSYLDGSIYCTGYFKVVFGPLVEKIPDYLFKDALVEDVTISESVKSIGIYAFEYASLRDLSIPDNVISLGAGAFYCCPMETAVVGSGVTEIPSNAFAGCHSLKEICFKGQVTDIGYQAFNDCISLSWIQLPDSLERIGDEVFSSCNALTHLVFGSKLVSLGNHAVCDCPGLQYIVFTGNAPSMGEYCFAATAARAYYPQGNTTYTPDVCVYDQGYGGYLVWIPVDMEPSGNRNQVCSILTTAARHAAYIERITDDRQFQMADADGDGTITSVDLVLLARYCSDTHLFFKNLTAALTGGVANGERYTVCRYAPYSDTELLCSISVYSTQPNGGAVLVDGETTYYLETASSTVQPYTVAGDFVLMGDCILCSGTDGTFTRTTGELPDLVLHES